MTWQRLCVAGLKANGARVTWQSDAGIGARLVELPGPLVATSAAPSPTRLLLELRMLRESVPNWQHRCSVYGLAGWRWDELVKAAPLHNLEPALGVLELHTGALRVSLLSSLPEVWGCWCVGCKVGGQCSAPIPQGRYWSREHSVEVHRFADADLAPLRGPDWRPAIVAPPPPKPEPQLDLFK